jgi:hypothetical protein
MKLSRMKPSQPTPSRMTSLSRPVARIPRAGAGYLAAALAAVAVIALAGCSSSQPPPFNPGGPESAAAATPLAQQTGPAGVTMPPFGTNAHIVMTGWLPKGTSLAQAVLTDKDYELAYLYSEYASGQSDDWVAYVSSALAPTLRAALSAQAVTTQSFKGTISFFDLAVARDPTDGKDEDVSGCVDTAQAENTSVATGKVLPGQSPSDSDYYRYTDVLAPIAGGQWQVVADYQPIYYPQAKECKP